MLRERDVQLFRIRIVCDAAVRVGILPVVILGVCLREACVRGVVLLAFMIPV